MSVAEKEIMKDTDRCGGKIRTGVYRWFELAEANSIYVVL